MRKQSLKFFSLFIFFTYSFVLFCNYQKTERDFSFFNKIPSFLSCREKETFSQKLAHAWSHGEIVLLTQLLDHDDFLLALEHANDKELTLFAQQTSYKTFKLFIENYYDLFLDSLERLTDNQLKIYLAQLPADFLKAVLFDTSQTRVDQLVKKLSVEKMSIIVTVTAQKLPNYKMKNGENTKNSFIRIEAFNRLLSSLSISQVNALIASTSSELLSELLAIFKI